jgi:hypothetical protein
MGDPMTFETRLAAAFERYLEGAPVDIDAASTAAVAVRNARARRGFFERLADAWWAPRNSRRAAALAVLGIVLLAMVATIALFGSHRINPLGSKHLFFTNGAYDCQDAFRYDVETGASLPWLDCVNRLWIAPGGARAGARGATSLDLIDLADRSRAPLAIAPGRSTTVAGWSPSGTWLHWVSCGDDFGPCRGFIGRPGSPTVNQIPEPADGTYNGSFAWSRGESAFFYWNEGGVFVAAGDGAGPARRPQWFELPMDIAPDGLSALNASGRSMSGGELAQSDLFSQPVAGGSPTKLTDNPDGSFVDCARWSPDGTRIAVIVEDRGTSAAPNLAPTDELLIVTPEGATQRRWPLPSRVRGSCTADGPPIAWASDASRLLIVPQDAPFDDSPIAEPYVITVATGAVVPLDGLYRMSFSPDGRFIAALEGDDGTNDELAEWSAALVIVDLEAGLRRSLGSVTAGPWSVLVWGP